MGPIFGSVLGPILVPKNGTGEAKLAENGVYGVKARELQKMWGGRLLGLPKEPVTPPKWPKTK